MGAVCLLAFLCGLPHVFQVWNMGKYAVIYTESQVGPFEIVISFINISLVNMMMVCAWDIDCIG